jgi:type I restriction enzyme R subunit
MNDVQNITKSQAAQLRLDERNHVDKTFLDQLLGLGWEIIDLDHKHRTTTAARSLPEIS